MSKRTIGIFFIISILMDLIGVGLIVGGVIGSTYTTTNDGYTTSAQMGHPALFALGVILVSLSSIPFLIAWIGALINLARLQQWVWFILMIFFNWITLLIYLIAGPTRRAGVPQYAQSMPAQYYQQQPQNYPPQYNYQQPPQYNPQAPQYNPEQQQNYSQPDRKSVV